ncbi:trigger factor [Pendulispora albinea]|uniref:Trigger factor n=2 Tax=Pendulispora albinea TaxID=2741071 RepID=A0ABZ2LQ43_9BACT
MMELQIEIPADTVKTEVDKAYVNLGKKAHVKGFRPGKAPRSVLSQLYGPQVQNDVANVIVNSTLPQVLTDKNVTPISQPDVEAGKIDPKAAFSYKARFEVSPEIEEVKYEGFELSRPASEVTDSMVDEQIERLRQGLATLKAPEPARPAQAGDIVVIDFTLSVDGKEVKDGGGQGVQLELGSKQILPELDLGLTGKSVGDKVEVTSEFPERHPREDFRGKKGTFAITVGEIKEKVLPNLDDEFAKDVGQFQTLVELRADVHTRLQKAAKDQVDTAIAEQIVEKLNENNPVEVPPSLVQQQCKLMETQILQQARRAGQPITQEQWAALHGTIHADAEKKVRAGLLMAHIARKLEIKVTDEDIENGLKELAEETGKNVAKVRAEYREKSKRDILIGMILEDKILDLLEAKSKIVDAPALPEGTSEAKESEEKTENA